MVWSAHSASSEFNTEFESTLQGSTGIQRDPNGLEEQTAGNLTKFRIGKCKILHLNWSDPKHQHRLGANWQEISFAEKEW